ncbi:methylmalonyl-CoA:pyruvate transcarboxylase [Cutibacterium acnes JCM 18918]|nr:methylmalonyl-CoA:pyruvate transcarboxylase [Cutibacterium acnes JCM 18918]
MFNVLMGNGSYKNLTAEFADLMLGYYGKPIGELNPEIVEMAKKQTGKEPIDCRPADLLEPEWDQLVEQAKSLEASTAPTRTFLPTPCSRELPRSSSRNAHRARRASR